MSLTATDVLHDASLFLAAYPRWPHANLALIDWSVPGPDRCGDCGHTPDQECECSCCPFGAGSEAGR